MTKTIRVFFVEDNIDDISSFMDKLEARKISVVHMKNAESFFATFKSDVPDFVVTDLQMPLRPGAILDKDAGEYVLTHLFDKGYPDQRTFVLTSNGGSAERMGPNNGTDVYRKGDMPLLVERIDQMARNFGPYVD